MSALRSLLKREMSKREEEDYKRGLTACAIFTADDYEAQQIAENIADLVKELSQSQGQLGGGGEGHDDDGKVGR